MPVTTLVTRPTRALAASAYLSLMMLMSCVVALAQGGSATNKADAAHYGADASKTASATVKVVAAAPKVAERAPDFRLPYATQEALFMKPEEQMTLASQRGKNVILAFYPADWSGGCTKEVCTLRDTFAELSKLKDRKSTRLNSSHANISYAV